jgi:uncharacterized protein YjbI with pentapeptide repeats
MSENTPEPKAPLFTAEELWAKANEIRQARNSKSPITQDDLDKASKVLTKEKKSWGKRFKKWTRTGEDGWNEKKPWDYLQLLLVPLVLAIAGFWFQDFSKKQEQLVGDNKAKQETLTKYLDQMSDLLQKGLIKSKHGSDLFTIAQAKTAVTLQSLDPVRQRLVIQFLESANLNKLDEGKGLLFMLRMHESTLGKAYLSLAKMRKADFRGIDLNEANLSETDLREANFFGANLNKANLSGADLRGAIFSIPDIKGANLSRADLRGATFFGVNLTEVDLKRAYLGNASFIGTDLKEAKLGEKQLEGEREQENFTLDLLINMANLDKKQLEREQEKSPPLLCKVILPKEIKVSPDRDCKKLSQVLLDKYPNVFKNLADAEKYMESLKSRKTD